MSTNHLPLQVPNMFVHQFTFLAQDELGNVIDLAPVSQVRLKQLERALGYEVSMNRPGKGWPTSISGPAILWFDINVANAPVALPVGNAKGLSVIVASTDGYAAHTEEALKKLGAKLADALNSSLPLPFGNLVYAATQTLPEGNLT